MNSLPESPAAERNAPPILAVLQDRLAPGDTVLEIGSGWGQHAVHFCRAMPGLEWVPSERPCELEVLRARVAQASLPGLAMPLALDVRTGPWPPGPFDAVYSANTAHIMAWDAVLAMLAGVAACLDERGQLLLYGPFNIGGAFTAPSNAAFDRELRARDPGMGIRDLDALEKSAGEHHLELEATVPMPANNMLLAFRKRNG